MKSTGIFVTEEERQSVLTEWRSSGMWISDGTPLGDPQRRVLELSRKYKLPDGTGLNTESGEFVIP